MTIDCRISSGSKPETTIGLPSFFAIHSYGRQPMTVETWPGPINASMRMSGESRIARIAGMIVTWLQKTEKLRMPSALARIKRQCGGGRRGFKTNGEKHHVLIGVAFASLSASKGE